MADLAADRGSRRTFCQRMPLCVLWQLLGDPDQVEGGTKLIGMWHTPTPPLHIADLPGL